MRAHVVLLWFVGGCELLPLALPCPEGPLTGADLPCDCQGAIVESVRCGQVTCTSSGPVFDKGDSGCPGTTFTSDSGF